MLLTTVVTPPVLRWRIDRGGGDKVRTAELDDDVVADQPANGWVEVEGGELVLVGSPPSSAGVPVTLHAAQLVSKARPSDELLEWLSARRQVALEWTAADTGHFKVSYVSGVNGSTIQTEGDYALSSRRARYTWTAKAGGSTFEADYVVDGHRSYGRSDLLSGFGDGCWLVVEDNFPQGKVPFYPTVQPAEFPANLEAFGSLHGVGQRQGVMIASATLTEVAKLFIATEEAYLVGVAARAGTNPVVDVRVGAARAGVAWGTTGTELIESIERATHPLGPDRRGSLSGAAAAEYTRIGERVHISVPPLVMQHTQWMRRPSKACI